MKQKRKVPDVWRAHIANYRKSNLTQREYCRRNDLKEYDLSKWKITIEKESQIRFCQAKPKSESPKPKLSKEKDTIKGSPIRLQWKGLTIEVQDGFNPLTLKNLMKAVSGGI